MKLFKKRESILARYAKAEFEALARQNAAKPPEERALIADFADEITSFLEKLERKLSGESGASMGYLAPMIASAVKYLMRFEPLAPLEDRPEDWIEEDLYDGFVWKRHARCAALSKRDDGIFYSRAIVFVMPEGQCFSGEVLGLRSEQRVRKMPFMPETFYVHLYTKDCDPKDPHAQRDPGRAKPYVFRFSDLEEIKRAAELYDVPPELSNRVQVVQSLGALK